MGPLIELGKVIPHVEKRPERRIFVAPVHTETVTLGGREVQRYIYGKKSGEGSKEFQAYFLIHKARPTEGQLSDPVVEIDPADPTRYIVGGATPIESLMTTETHVSIAVEKGTEVGAVVSGHPNSDISLYEADAVIATHGGIIRLHEKAKTALAQGGKIYAQDADIDKGIVTAGGDLTVKTAGLLSLQGVSKRSAAVHIPPGGFVDHLVRGGDTRFTVPMFEKPSDFIGKSSVSGNNNQMGENTFQVVVPQKRSRGSIFDGFGSLADPTPRKPVLRELPKTENPIALRLLQTVEFSTQGVEPFWHEDVNGYAHDPQGSVMRGVKLNVLYKTEPDVAMAAYRSLEAAADAAVAKIRALAYIDRNPREERLYREEWPSDIKSRGVRPPDDPTVAAREEKERAFMERLMAHFERQERERVPVRYPSEPPTQVGSKGQKLTWGMDEYQYPPYNIVTVGQTPERRFRIRGVLYEAIKNAWIRRKERIAAQLRADEEYVMNQYQEGTIFDAQLPRSSEVLVDLFA